MIISLIAAMDVRRGIGHNNNLAWRGKVPADMKHFRELTTGHPIVMGRKTYESMGRALPNRRNIVISRDTNFTAPEIEIFASPSDALAKLREDNADEIFIIGGAQIFTQMLPFAERIYMTYIEGDFPADTYFPELPADEWTTVDETIYPRDEKNFFTLRFITYQRKPRI